MSDSEFFRPEAVAYRKKRLHGDLTVVSEPVSNYIVGILLFATLLSITAASLGEYARTEIVTGVITTNKPLAKILVPRIGTVVNVMIKEGDYVNVGDKLIVVSVDTNLDETESYSENSLQSLARQNLIIKSQRDNIRNVSSLEKHRLLGELNSAIDQETQITSQIDLQEQLAVSLERTITKWESLAKDGYISEYALEEKRQQLLLQRQNLSKLNLQKLILKSQIKSGESQLSAVSNEEQRQMNENEIQGESIRQSSSAAKAAGHYVITAPVSGIVSSLMASPGRSLRLQSLVLNIIPNKTSLQAELYATSKAIGFVERGQSVRLLYDAFPYQKFGSYGGTVESVSRSAIPPNELDTPLNIQESVYRVRVKLSQEHVSAFGKNFQLQPGMILKGNIVLEKRSFFDWLLEPIRTVRERT